MKCEWCGKMINFEIGLCENCGLVFNDRPIIYGENSLDNNEDAERFLVYTMCPNGIIFYCMCGISTK